MAINDDIVNAERDAKLGLLKALDEVLKAREGAWIGQALTLAQAYAVVASRTPGGALPQD
jgi:hypothetical protein